MKPGRDIKDLIAIMARLRSPKDGCPWDVEQDFASIAPYTIEEAYEVADAIERGDFEDLREELGDLLLQVVFHAQMASEEGLFAFPDVVEAITTKLIRRHPHVFAGLDASDAAAVKKRWDEIKAEEKAERAARRIVNGGGGEARPGLLGEVPVTLPALARAEKLQKKAGKVGFDWNDPRTVLAKLKEEIAEIEEELDRPKPEHERVEDEVGDLLFAVANLARHLDVEPEAALMRANAKFARRFRHIETTLEAHGRSPRDATLEEMEALWTEAKENERRA